MLPQETIRRKRDGAALDAGEIEAFIAGLTSGAVTEGQAAAFAMAVFFNGMNLDERVALTRAMMRSGAVIDWSSAGLSGPVLDKHSTGGVGDNVSLMLAPMLAACGAFTPMISGRGLGHTGGTLDKLDSIPGYVAQPDLALFRRVVAEAGCAIIGQTADLAPADKRLYAIRDVTATVELIALITASILSKKLAAGLQGLAMDVKTGSGAFMTSFEGARDLAESLATVAAGAGLPTGLADHRHERAAGQRRRQCGRGAERRRLPHRRASRSPASHGDGRAGRRIAGARRIGAGRRGRARRDGARAGERRRRRTFRAHGGAARRPPRFPRQGALPVARRAGRRRDSRPPRRGFVEAIDVRAVGMAVVALGGGRARAADPIDPAVGFTCLAGLGAEVSADAPLALAHARDEAQARAAGERLTAAYRIGDAPPPTRDPVIERIAATR